jgi:hypothetical protein
MSATPCCYLPGVEALLTTDIRQAFTIPAVCSRGPSVTCPQQACTNTCDTLAALQLLG